MCEGTDWEVEWSSEIRRKARKAHWCRECRCPIKPGEHYFRCVSKTDGSVSDWAQCLKCHRVERAHMAAERSMGGDSSYYVGELLSQIKECIREEPHYLVAFRAAWKGEPVPQKPKPLGFGRYSTVL